VHKFTIGTRGSELARWQTDFVKARLTKEFPEAGFDIRIITTKGDAILDTALSKIGDKGLFTKEIEHALLGGEIDFAVHSLKDLPTTQPAGLRIAAVSARETPNDVFISSKYSSLDELPRGASVATGSLRRRSQLLAYRPDLKIVEIRGNVPTRIERFRTAGLDGLILAYAGVHRLGLDSHIRQIVPTEILLPAVGQGVMAIETRETDADTIAVVSVFSDREAEICITAERAFLRSLEGGCQIPIGANAVVEDERVTLSGFVGSLDGTRVIRCKLTGDVGNPESLGIQLAGVCIENGARGILNEGRSGGIADAAEVLH
jgi:hydroxymethylbilane synthase